MLGCRVRLLPIALFILAMVAQPAPCGTVISYSGAMLDADGITRSLDFRGDLNGTLLTGSMILTGNTLGITASIGLDGAILGAVSLADGTPLGTFAGKIDSQNVSVTYTAGGKSGSWSAPTSSISGADAFTTQAILP